MLIFKEEPSKELTAGGKDGSMAGEPLAIPTDQGHICELAVIKESSAKVFGTVLNAFKLHHVTHLKLLNGCPSLCLAVALHCGVTKQNRERQGEGG